MGGCPLPLGFVRGYNSCMSSKSVNPVTTVAVGVVVCVLAWLALGYGMAWLFTGVS